MAQTSDFRLRVARLANIVAVLLLLVVILFPIVWMVFASVRPVMETLRTPPAWLPEELNFKAYARLLSNKRELTYFVNTYIIAISTALLSTGIGVPAAYGFSRFRIRGARVILLGILAVQLMPQISLVLPYFNFAQSLGLYNTRLALVIANTAFVLPIAIWLLKGFLDTIPVALEEAAMIDGCSRWQCLIYVVFPLVLPGLIGTAIFSFLWAWNEFIFAVILTMGPDAAPLTVRFSQFFGQYGRDWNNIMALNVIAMLPLLAAFIWLQRWVVEGMTAGAVK